MFPIKSCTRGLELSKETTKPLKNTAAYQRTKNKMWNQLPTAIDEAKTEEKHHVSTSVHP